MLLRECHALLDGFLLVICYDHKTLMSTTIISTFKPKRVLHN